MAQTTDPTTGQRILDPMAAALMRQALTEAPMHSPWQLAGRLAQFGVGSWLDQSERNDQRKESERLLGSLPGLGAGPAAAPASPPSAPPATPGAAPTGPRVASAAPPATGEGPTWHIRNNNPMNIMALPGADKAYPGVAGTHTTRPGMDYLKFDSPDNGLAAAAQTLRYHARRGVDTPMAMMTTLAPNVPGHGNNPGAYATAVAQALGVSPTDKVDFSDPAVIAKVLPAIVRVETGVDYKGYTPDMYARAAGPRAQMAEGAPPGARPGAIPATQPSAPPPGGMPDTTKMQGGIPPDTVAWIREALRSRNPQMRQMALQLYAQYATPDKPTDEVRNYQYYTRDELRAGRQPTSFNEWELKRRSASTNQYAVNMPPAEKAADVESAKLGVNRLGDLGKAADQANEMTPVVARIGALLDRVNTGKFAETKLTIGQYAKSLGIDVGAIGFKGDELVNAETLRSLMISQVTKIAKTLGANPTNYDAQLLAKQVVNLDNTVEGNRQILKTTQDAIRFATRYEKEAAAYFKEHKNLYGFADEFAKREAVRRRKLGLPMPEDETEAPVVPQGAAPPPNVPGAPVRQTDLPAQGAPPAVPPPAAPPGVTFTQRGFDPAAKAWRFKGSDGRIYDEKGQPVQ